MSFNIYSDNTFLQSSNFGIKETNKGYLDYYVIDENNNHFSLLDNGYFINSRIYIKDSDRRFYLRDQGEYSISIKENTFNIKWRVKTLEINEKYTKNELGFLYNIDIRNKTDKDRNVGVYLIYDTFLGEEEKNHFIIDDNKIIKREKIFEGTEIPISLISKDARNNVLEFRFLDNSEYKPDSVILGNWDKLAYSKKWPYKPNNGSMFSNGYYSINDSGLGVVYNGVIIPKNKSINYEFQINFKLEKQIESKAIKEVKPKKDKKVWVKSEEPVIEEPKEIIVEVQPEVINIESNPNDKDESDIIGVPTKVVNTDKEDLLRMLEYIQKKRKGEDVSEYDFDEKYILEKLKERNE